MHGIFEYDQAKALAKAGYKVIYVAVDTRSLRRWRKWGVESFIKDKVNIEVINVPCGRIPKKWLYKIGELSLKKLYKIICNKYGKPDIIHGHFIDTGYITTKALSNRNIPIVLTEHSSAIQNIKDNTLLFDTAKYAYSHCNRLVVVSHSLGQIIKNKFGIQSICIPNIVDTSIFEYVKRNKKETFYFISVGSLSMLKRMDILIDGFNKAFKTNKDVNLYIFGRGNQTSFLEFKIKEYNL